MNTSIGDCMQWFLLTLPPINLYNVELINSYFGKSNKNDYGSLSIYYPQEQVCQVD